MPAPVVVRTESGKLGYIRYFHRRHVSSACWNCSQVTSLAQWLALGWEFYCSKCEVMWHEHQPR